MRNGGMQRAAGFCFQDSRFQSFIASRARLGHAQFQ